MEIKPININLFLIALTILFCNYTFQKKEIVKTYCYEFSPSSIDCTSCSYRTFYFIELNISKKKFKKETYGICRGCGWQPDNLYYSEESGIITKYNDTINFLKGKKIKTLSWSTKQKEIITEYPFLFNNYITLTDSSCLVYYDLDDVKRQMKYINSTHYDNYLACPNTKLGDLRKDYEKWKDTLINNW